MKKRTLHPLDFIFLNLEKKHQPMHLAGVLIFEIPAHAPADFVQQIATAFKSNQHVAVKPFNEVLQGLSWLKCDQINLDDHFQHVVLNQAELDDVTQFISQQHSQPLPRHQPMWQCILIEGLTHRRFALYFKVHHAKVDGIAGMRIISRALAHHAEDCEIVPLWSKHPTHPHQPKSRSTPAPLPLIERLKHAWTATHHVSRKLIETLRQRHHDSYTSTFSTPKSPFNQPISSDRTFLARSYDLTRLRRIADTFQCTMNDVILALCAGALRHYLQQHHQLPKQALTAFVPTSIRADPSSMGNRFTAVLANLATTEPDPIQRLKRIQHSMNYNKQRLQDLTANEIFAYSGLIYAVPSLQVFSRLMPTRQPFNLVISSLITSKTPLFLNGAKLVALYPASVLLDGQALNITMTSYLDQLDVGLLACPKRLPDIHFMLDYIEQSLQEYEQLI